jgi:hypothetical protein
VIEVGMISVIADILKFPYPLYPKLKRPYPMGLRFEITWDKKDFIFPIILPNPFKYELTSISISFSGYKDGDSFSLICNGDTLLDTVYTKEFGQVIDIRPVSPCQGTALTFIYHNDTGTSKIVWLDLMITTNEKYTSLVDGSVT